MTEDERIHLANDLHWIAEDIEDHRKRRIFISKKSYKFMGSIESRIHDLINKIDPTGDLAFKEVK